MNAAEESGDGRGKPCLFSLGEAGLQCLRKLFAFFDRPDIDLAQTLEMAAGVIAEGFRHAGRGGRMVIGGRIYRAGDGGTSQPRLEEPVLFRSRNIGKVEVFGGGLDVPGEPGLLIEEERELLRLIADGLGRRVSRKEMEEAWRWEAEQNRALVDLYAVAVMRTWTEKELDIYRLLREELLGKRTQEPERANLRLRRKLEERARKEELREMAERFRNLSSHLQSVREEERRCVAREVLDRLGQDLTGLK